MSIQAPRLLLALSLALPLALSAGPTLAQTHDHGSAASTALTLDHGQKWATDAPLRQAMGNLAQAVNQSLPAAHAGTLTDAQYDALGTKANQEFAYIVENCKLTPQADAALHVILADMVNGAEVIGGKLAGQPRADGVVRLAQALNRYSEYFDHPGWQEVQLPH
ncbi:MAG: hypothetical protein KUL86_15125 [Castellaniella sp.]|nr:hypothetical protein [Castellaniella sp.]